MARPTLPRTRIAAGLAGVLAMVALAGCEGTDLERGALGAAGGAGVAELAGADPVAGAVVGGTAGVVCDDVGAC
ncbi:hypothetical protein DLJ49_01060 [Rhodovulum sp. 12E13]|uniref:hypothetical protein n=1 Tax=Rhodovulum sp. 12E13 TaxID=2203891 RepID=UPI000E13C33F|nr:hypothetical protein [Rhodovulum sp. 12E13]RDC75371.1 hypothetical protein DLJ49_01060 [Rhodovulum sp. 12E13]